jgi:hypothetical protein
MKVEHMTITQPERAWLPMLGPLPDERKGEMVNGTFVKDGDNG